VSLLLPSCGAAHLRLALWGVSGGLNAGASATLGGNRGNRPEIGHKR